MVSIWLSKGCDDHQIPQPLLARYYNEVSELVIQGLASTMMGRLRPKGVNLIGVPADCICEATPSIVCSSNQHCSRPNIVLLRRNATLQTDKNYASESKLLASFQSTTLVFVGSLLGLYWRSSDMLFDAESPEFYCLPNAADAKKIL